MIRIAKVQAIGLEGAYLSAIQQVHEIQLYDDALEVLKASFPPGNHISPHFNPSRILIDDFFFDVLPLQGKWIEENNVRLSKSVRRSQIEILLKQLSNRRYDVVLFQGLIPPFHRGQFSEFRANNPRIRLVMAHLGHTFGPDKLEGIDLVLAASNELKQKFMSMGFKAKTYLHSFPSVVNSQVRQKFWEDRDAVGFVGSSGFGIESHAHRLEVLKNLMSEVKIQAFVDESIESKLSPRFRFAYQDKGYEFRVQINNIRRSIIKDFNHKIDESGKNRLSNIFPESTFAAKYGLEMFKQLGSFKATIHIHTSVVSNAAAMRLFEATGMGCCLISDGKNLNEMFKLDSEVVSFESPQELIDKVRFLSSQDAQARLIAERGRIRTLKEHSSEIRATQFQKILETNF
jgi:spore maturation protein CgeB